MQKETRKGKQTQNTADLGKKHLRHYKGKSYKILRESESGKQVNKA